MYFMLLLLLVNQLCCYWLLHVFFWRPHWLLAKSKSSVVVKNVIFTPFIVPRNPWKVDGQNTFDKPNQFNAHLRENVLFSIKKAFFSGLTIASIFDIYVWVVFHTSIWPPKVLNAIIGLIWPWSIPPNRSFAKSQ